MFMPFVFFIKNCNIILLLSLSTLLLMSCSTSSYVNKPYYDDVYFSSRDAKISQNPVISENNKRISETAHNQVEIQETQPNEDTSSYINSQEFNNKASYYDSDGNTYITNNYYFDDYYDYSYTARLRRFYSPYVGWSYYDDWYTNYYWYNYDPLWWGVSIYVGYNWWWPTFYYRPYYYYSWYWHPHYYGWHYWDNPWWAYNTGYWDGFYDGYYYAYNDAIWADYYYNSYDNNSFYYGPRTNNLSSNTPTNNLTNQMSFGQKYETVVGNTRPAKQTTYSDISSGKTTIINENVVGKKPTQDNVVSNDNSEIVTKKPVTAPNNYEVNKENVNRKPNVQNTESKNIQSNQNNSKVNQGNVSKPLYSKPQSINYSSKQTKEQQTEGKKQQSYQVKPYVAPNYSQPKSSQQYTAPKQNNFYNYTKPEASGTVKPNTYNHTPYYQEYYQKDSKNREEKIYNEENRNNNYNDYKSSKSSNYYKSNESYNKSIIPSINHDNSSSRSGGINNNTGNTRSGGSSGKSENSRRR